MRELENEEDRRKSSRKDKYKDSSKKRLLNNLKKKFDTTTIGSLAIVEDIFGELWGHGVHYNELTDEEKEWREDWNEARTKILDLGNLKKDFRDLKKGNQQNFFFKISEIFIKISQIFFKIPIFLRKNLQFS